MKKFLPALGIAAAIAAAPFAHGTTKASKALTDPELSERVNIYAQLLSVLQEQYVDSLDMDDIINTGIDAMLYKVDPYTQYYDRDNLDQLTSVSTGNYGGIGSGITKRDSVVIMSEPYLDKPAYLAGVRHGDILLSIDGTPVDARKMELDQVSARLKGNPGTTVTIRVRRPWLNDGSDSIFTFNIVRKKISIDPLPYVTVLDGGIGFMVVSTFNENTAPEIRRAFEKMKAEHGNDLKGVILDLRDNGGGIVDGAVDLLSMFFKSGTKVVETRYRNGDVNKAQTRRRPVDTDLPLVVLINNGTASASEIVAGAIQDMDRGVIMGRRSFGKGLVQTSAALGNGSLLKYTTGKYYLPSGRLVQALNYTHNDDENPELIPDSLTTAYQTTNGRTVRDGRGISPDVELDAKIMNQLIYQLYNNRWFEDFADRYHNRRKGADPAIDEVFVTDSVFEDFKQFVDPSRLKYGKLSQSGIDYLRQATSVEGLENDSVKNAIDNLERLIKHDLAHELDANHETIVMALETTIAARYFDDAVLEQRSVKNDEDVEQARKLLLDPERYHRLLVP